jgi:anti-sigma regulatory factor (Ser/Thr protein kinase)
MQPSLRMVFENHLEKLNHLMAVVRAYWAPYGLGGKTRFAVELILEEVVTNVIHHAFQGGTAVAESPHLIMVSLDVAGAEVHLRVVDGGRPFNPLSVPRLDVDQPFMERLEGGLGIHLVRQMMNSMAYRREAERNIFEIWIRDRDGMGAEGAASV